MQKITPFLWFDGRVEEAMEFYTSIFKNSTVLNVSRSSNGSDEEGQVASATFVLEGQAFIAFNGGPAFTFSPAISLFVDCATQHEVDDLWERLSRGGEKKQCGWLTDKFGLSWQIIPSILGDLLQDEDAEKSGRVMEAMLAMEKIDIEQLQQAHRGGDRVSRPASGA